LTHSGAASLLKEGVNLIVDGTEPDLVQDLLETRAATILRNRTIRGHMAIEGVMSIESGDNPRIVEHKMTTYFVEGGEYEPGPSTEPSLQKMIEDLGPTPVSRMSLNQMAWFYTHLASLRRQEGIEALAPIGEAADDSMLATGLREATHEDEGRRAPQQIIEAMKAHLQDLRVEIERRHWLVIEGIVGIQMGKKPKDLVKDAKAKAEQRVEELRSAGLPGPTS
jgi:hypothetical protein